MKSHHKLPLLVQKYGGATLADSTQIKNVALRIAQQAKTHRLIIAVSAMGKTTNELIRMAHEISPQPWRREMDMLLSVGERISMSLLSMALNDLNCPAISFTGSQAGILTDDSHVNAFIVDLKPIRVAEALDHGKVVIVAGFQGVSPLTKEITTLGRGGTDTTAVAMAAHFSAERCEILKDVAGVFTADPHLVASARPLSQLNYHSLLEMTFWGAKVLHYRSVELAQTRNVKLYIGPANSMAEGTIVQQGDSMFESIKALSLNSHECVVRVFAKSHTTATAFENFQKDCEKFQIAFPQLLWMQKSSKKDFAFEFLITGPSEVITDMENAFAKHTDFQLDQEKFSTVTMTCSGVTSPEISQKILSALQKENIPSEALMLSSMSASLLVLRKDRARALQTLHELI